MSLLPLLAREPWWKWGRPAEIWTTYRAEVEQFVKDNNLEPIPQQHLVAPMYEPAFHEAEILEAEARRPIRPRPFPGGLRFAHLHLGDQICRLDRKQWQDFSQSLVRDFQEKLENAQSVSLRQLLELGEATSELG